MSNSSKLQDEILRLSKDMIGAKAVTFWQRDQENNSLLLWDRISSASQMTDGSYVCDSLLTMKVKACKKSLHYVRREKKRVSKRLTVICL